MRAQRRLPPFRFGLLLGLAALAAVLAAAGCQGRPARGRTYMPDMARPVSYDAYAPNPVTRNGQTLQRPVAGTIPRGFHPLHYAANAEGAEQAGRELVNPLPPTPQNLARGQRVYQTFCRVCHGDAGHGDGPIVPTFPAPPDYAGERLLALPEGRIFHTITYGTALMPSYASQILPEDRWRAVLYVRRLQAAGSREAHR